MASLDYIKLGLGAFFMLLGAYISLGLGNNAPEVIFGIILAAVGISVIASSQK